MTDVIDLTSDDIYEQLRHIVLLTIDKNRLDVNTDQEEIREVIEDSVVRHNNNALIQRDENTVNVKDTIHRLEKSIFGFGPLQALFERQDIEEIFIEGSSVKYLDSTGFLRGLSEPTTENETKHIINKLLSETDRTLTTRSPIVQARVLGGSARLTASIAPVSDVLSATIRKYVVKNISLQGLVAKNALTPKCAGLLWALMQTRSRIVISGEPGAGKTTLLSAMLSASPVHHCIRSCEEIREISVPFQHGGYYEVRHKGLDETGEITLRDLVKFTLAMRPDRIVCGEVRGAEAFELSRAINAGCGFACTIHSNNAVDALEALVNASLMAGENVSESIMRKVFSNSIDVVIHVDREENPNSEDGILRGVTQVIVVEPNISDTFTTTTLFSRDTLTEPLIEHNSVPTLLEKKINKNLPSGLTLSEVMNDFQSVRGNY